MEKEGELPDNCVNCGSAFAGDYCHSCGQKREVHRLTLRNAWIEFQQFFLGLDTKFLRTFRTIWVDPGRVALANIKGNRVLFVGPVGYLFVVLTLLLLLVSAFDVSWTEFMAESITAFEPGTEQQSKFQQESMQQIFNNFRAFQFMMIPFIALSAKIWFRKSGFNYLEHMVLIFYVQAQMVFITILNLFVFVTFDKTFLFVSMPITVLFYGFACVSFYPGKSGVLRFIKGMFVQAVGLIFFTITFTIILVAIVFYLSATNPDFMKQFEQAQ